MANDAKDQPTADGDACRVTAIEFDTATLPVAGGDSQHERAVAAADFADTARLTLLGGPSGPYHLRMSVAGDRLVLRLRHAAELQSIEVAIVMRPLRQVIRDYRILCDSYLAAVRTAPVSRIAEIDRERRDVHDRGAALLIEETVEQLRMPQETARKLFTLVAVLGR